VYSENTNNFDNTSEILYPPGTITSATIKEAVKICSTPFYLYDGSMIEKKCRELKRMPNAFGLTVRFAIKANPSKSVLQLIDRQGLMFEAGSLNEVKRAQNAGIPLKKILLTSQDTVYGEDLDEVKIMMTSGLNYTICSFNQLKNIADFASVNNTQLSIRIHPGMGSGESATRNTGDLYASFGVQKSELPEVFSYAKKNGIKFTRLHVHIGSGSDPDKWKENVDKTLETVEKHFPDVTIVDLGGGFKVARMPDEKSADIIDLGNYTKQKFTDFYFKTGRQLSLEIEPGTFVVANSGFLVTSVIDIKPNQNNSFTFYVLNGGMESNPRPLMYGSSHPFYIVDKNGKLIWSDYSKIKNSSKGVLVGRCCETGDSQCLNPDGTIDPRPMATPEIGDYVVIGGTGAYCSSMAPFNYNSYLQAAELMKLNDNSILLIRKQQTFDQLTANELSIEDNSR